MERTVQRMLDLMGLELRGQLEPIDGGIQLLLGGADQSVLAQKDGELLSPRTQGKKLLTVAKYCKWLVRERLV